jgi:hypothetical protein
MSDDSHGNGEKVAADRAIVPETNTRVIKELANIYYAPTE